MPSHSLRLLPLLLVPWLAPAARADRVELKGGAALGGVVLDDPGPQVRLVLDGGAELHLDPRWVRQVARDAAPPAPGQHLRAPDADGEGLSVALTHLVHPTRPRVDLVAAVHVADPAYFHAVQRWLDAADLVFYEGIAPAGTSPTAARGAGGAEPPNPLRRLQQALARALGLAFQLDEMRYDRAHFRPADLTLEELKAALAAAGPSAAADGAPAEGAAAEAQDPLAALGPLGSLVEAAGPMLEALLARQAENPVMRRQFRALLARALGGADLDQALGRLPAGVRDLILTRRNEVVLKHLEEVPADAAASVAVFYGAAHMAGIERGLVERLGYRRAGARWLKAWDLDAAPAPGPTRPAPKPPDAPEPEAAPAGAGR